MGRIILHRTGERSVAFEGKRILFEAADVGCAHFEFHGYVAHSPVNCFVMAIHERRQCGDTRDVAVFDDQASLEKGLAAARGGLSALKMVFDLASGADKVLDCETCPRARRPYAQ